MRFKEGFPWKGPMHSMTSVQRLYELQELDTALEKNRAALAVVEAQLGETEALRAARQALVQAREEQARLAREQRDMEREVQDADEKIKRTDKRLYGGTVKSPKELMNLEEELQRLKTRRGSTEDRLLALLEAAEKAQETAKARATELEIAERTWQQEQKRLAGEQARLKKEIASLESRRQAAAGLVAAPTLALYEELRAARQGQAVARVGARTCMGCRISLPETDFRRAVRGDELIQCPNCRRFLYHG